MYKKMGTERAGVYRAAKRISKMLAEVHQYQLINKAL